MRKLIHNKPTFYDFFLAPGGLYPTLKSQDPFAHGGGGGGYGPPPNAYSGGPDPSRRYGYQPGFEKPEEEEAFGGCLDKVGLAVGGLIAAGGVAAAMHAYNVNFSLIISLYLYF